VEAEMLLELLLPKGSETQRNRLLGVRVRPALKPAVVRNGEPGTVRRAPSGVIL
jgi:hypothetical protein